MKAALKQTKQEKQEAEAKRMGAYNTMMDNLEKDERAKLAELLRRFTKLPHELMSSDNDYYANGELVLQWRVARRIYVDKYGILYRGRFKKPRSSFSRNEVSVITKSLEELLKKYSL